MFNPKILLALGAVVGFFGLIPAQAYGYGDDAVQGDEAVAPKQVVKKQVKLRQASRGLASLSGKSTAQMGQGELMLNNLKSTTPRFLKPANTTSRVHIAGVCRDVYGTTFNSTEKGYSTCLDAKTEGSSSVNEYFGSAQRQAGVGILVGN